MDKRLRKRLEEAAQIIVNESRKISSKVSKRIPLATQVISDGQGVRIETDGRLAPNNTAWDYGARHPVNRSRTAWASHPRQSYTQPAIDRTKQEFLEAYAKVIDDVSRENGWR